MRCSTFAVAGAATISLAGCALEESEGIAITKQGLHADSSLLTASDPTVCFVRDWESSLSDTEFSALTEEWKQVISTWQEGSGLRFQWMNNCAGPSQKLVNSRIVDIYPETFRIFVNEKNRSGSTLINGRGCTKTWGNGNWGSFPYQQSSYRSCQWNLMLDGSAPPINNTLHETGHSLGFIHEHQRTDNTDTACGSLAEDDNGVFLTEYDVMSVMHYHYGNTGCPAPGNSGNTGLSDLDRLGVSIAYPAGPDVDVLHSGMRSGSGWILRSDTVVRPSWLAQGADPSVFSSVTWAINSVVKSTQVDATPASLGVSGSASQHLALAFSDPWQREKHWEGTVTVSDKKHTALVMAAAF